MNRNRARQMRAKRIRAILILACAVLALVGVAAAVRHFSSSGGDAQATPRFDLPTTPSESPAATPDSTETPTLAPTQSPTPGPTEALTPEPTEVATPAPANPAATRGPDRGSLPLSGLKIGLDPGHQTHADSSQEAVTPGGTETKAKVSSGTQGVSTRVPEYEVNLQVSLLLRDRLVELGAEVFMTREENDVSISNQERAIMMNDLGADLVLRIHCNGSTDSSVNGISLFVRATGEGAEEAYAAAEALLPAMLEATGANDAGIYKRDTYTGLNWSVPPSILVEMGFMSNPEEDQKLCDPDYQALLVEGMARGVADCFGRTIPES